MIMIYRVSVLFLINITKVITCCLKPCYYSDIAKDRRKKFAIHKYFSHTMKKGLKSCHRIDDMGSGQTWARLSRLLWRWPLERWAFRLRDLRCTPMPHPTVPWQCMGFWLFYLSTFIWHFLAHSKFVPRGWIRLHVRDPYHGEHICPAMQTHFRGASIVHHGKMDSHG